MSVHLKLEESDKGLRATISQRNDAGKIIGPRITLPETREDSEPDYESFLSILVAASRKLFDRRAVFLSSPVTTSKSLMVWFHDGHNSARPSSAFATGREAACRS